MWPLACEIGQPHQQPQQAHGGEGKVKEGFAALFHHITHGQFDEARGRFIGGGEAGVGDG